MIILDTNVVSALMRDEESTVALWLDTQPATSVWTTAVTVLECRFGIERLPAGRRRDALAEAFVAVLKGDLGGRILSFGEADAIQTAKLVAARQASGRSIELRDAMIAGIALARRSRLATRNTKHFEGLDVVDPWAC